MVTSPAVLNVLLKTRDLADWRSIPHQQYRMPCRQQRCVLPGVGRAQQVRADPAMVQTPSPGKNSSLWGMLTFSPAAPNGLGM